MIAQQPYVTAITAKKATMKRLRPEVKSPARLSDKVCGLIDAQFKFVEKSPKTILTGERRLFVLGYIYGYVDVMQQATTDNYDQSASETAWAEVMQKLLGNDEGAHAYEQARENMRTQDPLFMSGLTTGGQDATGMIADLTPFGLAEALADTTAKAEAIEKIRALERVQNDE